MPPRTRATKTSKASKENIGVVERPKLKGVTKVSNPRKALADKTNSASDDNASTEFPKKISKKVITKTGENENKERPRRERRLPNRFVENQVLKNLSNSIEVDVKKQSEAGKPEVDKNKSKTPSKNDSSILSPFKSPENVADNSLIANRPRRVCRLPSRFDDVSPNKFIPVGCHASTPILQSKAKPDNVKANEKATSLKVAKQLKVTTKKSPVKNKPDKSPQKNNSTESSVKKIPQTIDPIKSADKNRQNEIIKKKKNDKSPIKENVTKVPKKPVTNIKQTSKPNKANADTNNNAEQRLLRKKVTNTKVPSPEKTSPIKESGQKLLEKSFSFRVLEDKKKSLKRDNSHLDVYEFTYDPNEEPPPQKKKKKRAVRKKPAKPKTVIFKNNYDQNVNKALAALKNVVTKKQLPVVNTNVQTKPQNTQITQKPTIQKVTVPDNPVTNAAQSLIQDKNHVSVGIEDIAADIEPMDHHEIDYSPVTSPNRGKSPMPAGTDHSVERQYQDPLNLQECLSFFDEPPVASSSMNMSTRKPHETPWRVQFEQLPIKWQVNTYVKANMTPAVESSFINFEDSKKKHVYTNMVAEANEDLPEIVDDNQSKLKQTSIISFIKEVVERSASKKKRAKSVTPTKANSIFEDISNISVNTNKDVYRTPNKTPRRNIPENSTPNRSAENDLNNEEIVNTEDKENSNESKKTTKTKVVKENDKDGTFFGFDESEDQENVSPLKIDNPRVRALRPRARAVLQEINAQTGPSRPKVPLAAKNKIAASSEVVNKVFEEMKSASDAPVFPEKDVENITATDVEEQIQADESDEDCESVHLFEDIEVIHHVQPSRKSYGKAAKKVTFQGSTLDDESQVQDIVLHADSDDDVADITFTMPNVQQKSRPKKKTKKKDNLSKKEKAELDAWAAGFNSMCEDIEEFPLMVE